MLELGLILVLAAHLLLVDLAMAGPLGAMALEWSAARRGDVVAAAVARRLVVWSIAALTLAMLLGGILLALKAAQGQSRYWLAVQHLPPSRLWYSLAELAFYYACLGGYLLLNGKSPWGRILQRLLAVMPATNLMYHFPPLFSILSLGATRPELQGVEIDRHVYRALMMEGEVLARVVHVWLASLAVLGVTLMAYGWRLRPEGDVAGEKSALVGWGARLALLPTLLQLPVGMWVFWTLPAAASESLLGADWLSTALFAGSLLIALRLMHCLAAVALGDREPRQIVESIVTMATVVVLMTGVLHRVENLT